MTRVVATVSADKEEEEDVTAEDGEIDDEDKSTMFDAGVVVLVVAGVAIAVVVAVGGVVLVAFVVATWRVSVLVVGEVIVAAS
jgi:cytochrome b subunit of formate dehydrogenase